MGDSWRSGVREAIHHGDPLARAPHPLVVAHHRYFKREVDAKLARLMGKGVEQ